MEPVLPSLYAEPEQLPKVYQNLFSLILKGTVLERSEQNRKRIHHALQQHLAYISPLDAVSSLVNSHQYRVQLLQISSDLQMSDHPSIRTALQKDQADILNLLKGVLSSDAEKSTVLGLQEADAQNFVNLVQDVLDRGPLRTSDDDPFCHDAHRLLVKLSEDSNVLPSALSVNGVTLPEKHPHPTCCGGFADIFRAFYQGKEVALKRMRVSQRDERSQKINGKFRREAVMWRQLRHPFVLPFFGIDYETFSPFPCLVLPWMQRGTILKHLKDTGNLNADTRIFEVAQGLEYLHSQNIIHGDLRGSNILIDEAWHAVIADFGLAVFVDATANTSHGSGSIRWMAPELINPTSFELEQSRRTPASDVYAFACACLEIYTGRPPFSDAKNDGQVVLQVMGAVRPERPSGDPGRVMPDYIWSVVERSWVQQPFERPRMSEVVRLLQKGHQLSSVSSKPVDHNSTSSEDEGVPKDNGSLHNQLRSLAARWSSDDITNEPLSSQQAVTGSQSQTQQLQSLPSGWTIDTEATWPSHASEPLTSRYNAGMRPISHQDIIIAVMGPAGVGKSSFINIATRQTHANLGHDLESCTQDVRAVSCPHRDGSGRHVVLVEIPGFGDTSLSDCDILERTADWLMTTYQERIILSGLLFFHHISNNRLGGPLLRYLSMFKKLCGPDAFQNVILTTTMCDEVDEAIGLMREKQLRTTYWRSMITFGSKVARFGYTYDSAWDIIDKFANTTRRPVCLQQEMVDQGKDLPHTAAGTTLFQFQENIIANCREILQKLDAPVSKENDPEKAAAIKKEKLAVSRELEQAIEQKRKVDPQKQSFQGVVGKVTVGSSTQTLPAPQSNPCPYPADNGNSIEQRGQTLAVIISALERVKSVGRVATIPFLSGAVGLVLTLAKSVQAAKFTESSLLSLTREAGCLIFCVAEQAQKGSVSDNTRDMVENLVSQLKIVKTLVDRVSSPGLMSRHIFLSTDQQVVSSCHNSVRLACDSFESRTSISIHRTLAQIETRLVAMSMSNLTPNFPVHSIRLE